MIFDTRARYIAPSFGNGQCSGIPVGVLSSDATRRQAIRNPWGAQSCVYFIVGTRNGTWPHQEAAQRADVVLLDMEEVYHGLDSILPYKTALWFYLGYQHFPRATHILKTDDDSYVNIGELEREMAQVDPDYWGYVHRGARPIRDPEHKWYMSSAMWRDDEIPDYCTGAGYLLSRRVLGCYVSRLSSQHYIA